MLLVQLALGPPTPPRPYEVARPFSFSVVPGKISSSPNQPALPDYLSAKLRLHPSIYPTVSSDPLLYFVLGFWGDEFTLREVIFGFALALFLQNSVCVF
jgi:hypothetical protein